MFKFKWDDKKGQIECRETWRFVRRGRDGILWWKRSPHLWPGPFIYYEEKFILLGMGNRLRMLVVVHPYVSSDEVIRIISVRKATRHESRQYLSWRAQQWEKNMTFPNRLGIRTPPSSKSRLRFDWIRRLLATSNNLPQNWTCPARSWSHYSCETARRTRKSCKWNGNVPRCEIDSCFLAGSASKAR